MNSEVSSSHLASLKHIFDNIDIFIYVTDMETHNVIYMNEALIKYMDLRTDISYCWQLFDYERPCDHCKDGQLFDPCGNPVNNFHKEIQSHIDNKWYSLTVKTIDWIDGRQVCLEYAMEITGRKQAEQVLEKSATTDSLTAVFNREWGYRLLNQTISEMQKTDSVFSLIFIDINHLKITNDTLGHAEGDKTIKFVVDMLSKSIRKHDIIFRWGGDEFVIILPCCTRANALNIMEKANQKAIKTSIVQNMHYPVSFAYGIKEVSPDENLSADAIIDIADSEMYEHKFANRK